MDKICKNCKSVSKSYPINIKSSVTIGEPVYLCKNIKYKRKCRDKQIELGNEEAKNFTDAMLKKYSMSTEEITTECEFFKAEKK